MDYLLQQGLKKYLIEHPEKLSLETQEKLGLTNNFFDPYGVKWEGARQVLYWKNTRPFYTNKGHFFTRWNYVWGQPDTVFENWPESDRNIFSTWYFDFVTRNQYVGYVDINWNIFDQLESTISDIVNLEGDNTVLVRNGIGELINKAGNKSPGWPSHTEKLFGLHYNHWDNVLKPLMRRHYKSYDIFCIIEEKIIVPYWDARTKAETEQRNNLIKNIGLIIAGTAIAIITAGFSTGVVADAASKIVSVSTDITIPPEAIEAGLNTLGSISAPSGGFNVSLPDIGGGIKSGVEEIGKQISRINLDPTQIKLPDIGEIKLPDLTESGKFLSDRLLGSIEKIDLPVIKSGNVDDPINTPVNTPIENTSAKKTFPLIPLILAALLGG